MTITTWVDDRIKVMSTAIVDALWDRFDKRLGDLEANVGAMFTTVSKDVQDTANTISGDVRSVSDNIAGDINGITGAITKSTEDTIAGVGQAITNAIEGLNPFRPR
jgi:phage-related protein